MAESVGLKISASLLINVANLYTDLNRVFMEYIDNSIDSAEAFYDQKTNSYKRNIEINFDDEALEEIAHLTEQINKEVENIGARRLQTIFEKILEEISFDANHQERKIQIIDKKWVIDALSSELKPQDDKKFIL